MLLDQERKKKNKTGLYHIHRVVNSMTAMLMERLEINIQSVITGPKFNPAKNF